MEPPATWLKRTQDYLLRRDHKLIALHVCFVGYACFSLFLTFYRNPWRDEAQAWLLARDLGPLGLFVEARHDGHPILWHLCLKLLQAFGINYLGMMVLNWVFMGVAIWLLFYRSTLPLIAKVAVALCPACLLELSCTARNYAISAALIFTAALLYRDAAKKPILFCVVLALLANTNIYATAVFAGISFQFLFEQAWDFGHGPVSLRPLYTRYLVPNLILLVGALLVIAQLAPIPLPGEVPIPKLQHEQGDWVNRDLVVVILISCGLAFFSKGVGFPRIVGGILAGFLALIPATVNPCATRHIFMLVLGIVYFIWIYLDDIFAAYALTKQTRLKAIAALLIIIACAAPKHSYLKDVFVHAWDSKNTASSIIAHHLDSPDTLMVVTQPVMTTPLLMLMKNVRTDYGLPPYPPGPISFADFYDTRLAKTEPVPTLEDLKPQVIELARENPSKTIMVVSSDIKMEKTPDDPDYKLNLIYASPIVHTRYENISEFYQIYVLQR